MIERILAHKKQSRWQRAGGLGFAIGFLLLELITGLINLIETDFTQYSSFFGIVKYSIPMEGAAVSSGMPQSTPFDLVGLAAILVAGLVAGWVFGRAAQPDHQLRFTLAGMTAFCGAFVWIFLGSLALRTANRVVGLLGALVIIALMGALISTIFAVIAIPSSRSRLLRFGAVGLYAFLIGIAASLLAFLPAGFVVLPVAAVLWLSNIQGILGLSMLLLAMISGCVLGWVYGVWVGGELEKTQLRVSLSPVEA